MLYKHGLFPGKFLPFHVGHYSQILYLSGICEKLDVIVFEDDKNKLDFINKINLKNVFFYFVNNKNSIMKINKDVDALFYSDPNNLYYKKYDNCLSKKIFRVNLNSHNNYDSNNNFSTINNSNLLELKKIYTSIKSFHKLNQPYILILGDIIQDIYIDSVIEGLSSEEPMIVYRPIKEDKFQGGAQAIYNNLKIFNKNTFIISPSKVSNFFNYKKKLVNTTKKIRYRVDGRSVFKITEGNLDSMPDQLYDDFFEIIQGKIHLFKMIIFSDFDLGFLKEKFVNKVLKLAKKNNVITLVDGQTSSRYVNLKKYKEASFFSQTILEVETFLGKKLPLGLLHKEFIKEMGCDNLFIKLGKHGSYVRSKLDEEIIVNSLAKKEIDSSGCGDAFLVGIALSILSGIKEKNIMEVANMFAAIQLSRLSNQTISHNDINNFLIN